MTVRSPLWQATCRGLWRFTLAPCLISNLIGSMFFGELWKDIQRLRGVWLLYVSLGSQPSASKQWSVDSFPAMIAACRHPACLCPSTISSCLHCSIDEGTDESCWRVFDNWANRSILVDVVCRLSNWVWAEIWEYWIPVLDIADVQFIIEHTDQIGWEIQKCQ